MIELFSEYLKNENYTVFVNYTLSSKVEEEGGQFLTIRR